MILFLEGVGEASVKEMAEAFRRPADGLYHHIHRLEEAGLIERCGYRHGTRRDEALYRVTGLNDRMEPGASDASAFAKMASVLSRHVIGGLESALEADPSGLGTQHRFRAEFAWLTREEWQRVSGLFDQALEVFRLSRGRGAHGRRALALMVLTPDLREGGPEGRPATAARREGRNKSRSE